MNHRFFETSLNHEFFKNPAPGTVVFSDFSSDNRYEFYMTPQQATEGSCTPIHCIVACSNQEIPQEELAQFIFEQCFNYFNWTGTVKVPAVLQYANKLARHIGETI